MARYRDDRDEDDDEEEDRRPRRRRSRDDYDNEDDDLPQQTKCPGGAKAAAIIWIIVGIYGIVSALAQTIIALTREAAANSTVSPVCSILFAIVIGAVFLMVGIQTLKGAAKGMMGNAIGSIVFGVLFGGGSLLILIAGGALAARPAVGAQGNGLGAVGGILLFLGAVSALLGIALIVAGILAIVVKENYRRWREYKEDESDSRRRSRRKRRQREEEDDDEEEDERPRRRRRDDDDD